MAYTELVQISEQEEREQTLSVIRAMDGAYLDWVRKQHG